MQRHGCKQFRCAVAEMQGWRTGHEDAHSMRCHESFGSFWVLDGHGGEGAANFGAPALSKEFEWLEDGALATDARISEGFASVDSKLRAHFREYPDQDSGSTVVGLLVHVQRDGTYSAKLLNCGDSRGVVVRGPDVAEGAATESPVRIPEHLRLLSEAANAAGGGAAEAKKVDDPLAVRWPIVAESIDHKPNHPTEKARIENAGGHVSEEEPPRLDGNLAVSRGLGDFEYKQGSDRPVSEQKVSVVPDVYEVTGLSAGTICILACDGVWDVMSGQFVANHIRDRLQRDPTSDLGEIAVELVRESLRKNSRDNVTLMIVQFCDGSDWSSVPDEMTGYDKLVSSRDEALDEEVRNKYKAFLQRANFFTEPRPCSICTKWYAEMNQCPCKTVDYCSRACQKKGWKAHKVNCTSAVRTNSESPQNKKDRKSTEAKN